MAKFMKNLAVAILIFMIIGSFILGDTFKTVTYQSAYRVETEYNLSLVICGLLGSAIFFAVLYSIGYALERLDGMEKHLSTLNDTARALFEHVKADGKTNESKETSDALPAFSFSSFVSAPMPSSVPNAGTVLDKFGDKPEDSPLFV